MKYTVEIELNISRSRTVELFDNSDNMTHWQPDLISFTPISGEPGKVGAKSKLVYKMGKRVVEMVETITKNELPNELSGTYEAKGVYNIISNRFEMIDETKTLWISENEFQFSGFMKLIGVFMKGSFPKQTLKFMNQFKEFAEKA
ncbi:MAG: SRPBCC family protein [Reichenbachiella sp.]